jgi:hypothetical protein
MTELDRRQADSVGTSAISRSVATGAVGSAEPATRSIGLFNLLRPLVVGIVHGLAGSAAIALIVMTTIRDPWGGDWIPSDLRLRNGYRNDGDYIADCIAVRVYRPKNGRVESRYGDRFRPA